MPELQKDCDEEEGEEEEKKVKEVRKERGREKKNKPCLKLHFSKESSRRLLYDYHDFADMDFLKNGRHLPDSPRHGLVIFPDKTVESFARHFTSLAKLAPNIDLSVIYHEGQGRVKKEDKDRVEFLQTYYLQSLHDLSVSAK